MFDSLPHTLRKHKLSGDVRTLLLLRKSFERGLINTIGDLYLVLKGIVTNDPKEFGPFAMAFYEYFLDVPIKQGQTLESALLNSETFKQWRKALEDQWDEKPGVNEMIERFLDEVHTTTLDIKKVVSGKEIFDQNDPNRQDTNPEDGGTPPEKVTEGADYGELTMEELKERLRKIQEQQKGKHSGGSHWIGTGGRSAFGHGGAAMNGIRVGGGGGGKMARAVINDKRFYPIDADKILQDDNMDVALTMLKGIEDESAEKILDVEYTITEGLKQGGIFLPYEKEKIQQKMQVILIIDNGGMSMTPYVRMVRKLFSKMKRRFAHDLKTYYYHNTIYDGLYTDERRLKFEKLSKVLQQNKNYSVFVIGDADMAPSELTPRSYNQWEELKKRFPRMVWLNPMEKRFWNISDTVPFLRRIFPMYGLTPKGIEEAVKYMNKKRKYAKASR